MSSDMPIDRDAHFALTGEKYTDENIFGVPVDGGETDRHTPAVDPAQTQRERDSLKDEDNRSRQSRISSPSAISGSFSAIRHHARKAVKKTTAAVSTLGRTDQGPKWVEAETGLSYLHGKDIAAIKDILEVVHKNYNGGKLYFRKVHVGKNDELIEWQVKFDHDTRGYEEQARSLKDAVRKVKSFLEFKEPGEQDKRFKRLYEVIRDDKRYKGALILFKEGKSKDWYPWKVRIHHGTRGWITKAESLSQAISAMEDHLEYEEVTLEAQDEAIWGRVVTELEKYPKCKVFFKEIDEPGPDGEPGKIWVMKVDHPVRGVQFEAKSRIFQAAIGQIYDYLVTNIKDDVSTRD